MKYDKPFKTLDEQLDVLERRGLTFHDRTHAKKLLMTYSYYDLINGYKDIFMPKDIFKPGTRFLDLVFFAYIDKSIQSLIIKYSLIAETKFKNHIAYVLSKNLGVHPDDYLNPKYFKQRVNKTVFFSSILEELKKQLDGKRDSRYPTKYYVNQHNHVPPWILFKNISLGTAINLFKSTNSHNKAEIANMLLPQTTVNTKKKIEFISIAMNQIRLFRNCTAHNLNFVKCRTTQNIPSESLYKLLSEKEDVKRYTGNIHHKDRASLRGAFGIILSLYVIIHDGFTSDGLMLDFISTLESPCDYANLYQEYLKIANIPLDVRKRLSKLIPAYFET